MSTPTIAVTGANGFLGRHLVDHFSQKGWSVIALVRDPSKHDSAKNVRYATFNLSQPFDDSILSSCDYLVHTAYIQRSTGSDSIGDDPNVTGTTSLYEQAVKYNVKKRVFISSMSSKADAISFYGKQKFAIEQLFSTKQDVSIRPGFILGDGGLYKRMATFMQKWHIAPVISGGKQPLQVIHVADVVRAVDTTLHNDLSGLFVAAHPTPVSYKDFYRAIAQKLNIKVLFITVPYFLIYGLLSIVSKLPFSSTVSTDNLRGLRKLTTTDTTEDSRALGLSFETIENYIIAP